MPAERKFNRLVSRLGIALLLIWWGIVIAVDPLTISIGAIGTGLILLGLNALRAIKGISRVTSTTTIGLIALIWGGLYQAWKLFQLPPVSAFGLLLLVIGVISGLHVLVSHTKRDLSSV
jgi:hypothetical protein